MEDNNLTFIVVVVFVVAVLVVVLFVRNPQNFYDGATVELESVPVEEGNIIYPDDINLSNKRIVQIDEEVINSLETEEKILVTIVLNHKLNESLTREEKIELQKQKQAEILSSLSGDEFILDRTDFHGTFFSGYITEKGLEKLKNNQDILSVHLPELAELH